MDRVPACQHKTIDGNRYRYCYYSCRAYCRSGKEACPGVRVATEVLDEAVLAYIAERVCTSTRIEQLRKVIVGMTFDELTSAWRALVTADLDVGRAYAMHLIERFELLVDRATVVPKKLTAEV